MERATRLQRRTNVLNALLCRINNIAAYKVVLKAEGVILTSHVRRPMENLTDVQEQELLDALKQLTYRKVLA